MLNSDLFKQTPHPKMVDDAWHIFNRSNCLNAIYWNFYFQQVEHLEFDSIVECGVGRGRSLITLLSLESLFSCVGKRNKRQIFALDSFEGFPEPTDQDKSPRNSKKGEWATSPNATYKYSPDFLKLVLQNAELESELANLTIVKGYFDQTCKDLNTGRIGLLHLDGDLYESVRAPLISLWEKVVVGGIVVIDDFLAEKSAQETEAFPGARKAIEEFLSSNNCFEIHTSVRGTPYLVRKR